MIRSIILESGRPGMNPESNLISCMISENGPNFSGPHFFVSKVEPRQLPNKGELNEKRHAQFLAQHQPHSDRQWFTAVANTDAKTLNILHVQLLHHRDSRYPWRFPFTRNSSLTNSG